MKYFLCLYLAASFALWGDSPPCVDLYSYSDELYDVSFQWPPMHSSIHELITLEDFPEEDPAPLDEMP